MTIKAYTFESSQTAIDGSQLAPYTSKVDARVNRDLFNGHGDLIIVGDRNGKINRDVIRSNIEQLVTDGLKFSIPDYVTFLAGGRLITLTDEIVDVDVTASIVNNQSFQVGFADLVFDIDTKSQTGQFVTISKYPKYPTGLEAWEQDTFSSVYKLILVYDGAELNIYPSPDHNGQNAAGSTFSISTNGTWMHSGGALFRGKMINNSNLFLSQNHDIFTLSGKTDSLVFDGDDIKFGKQIEGPASPPFGLNITTGTITLFTEGWALMGTLTSSHNRERNGYYFTITDVKTVFGKKPTWTTSANVIANFNATWDYF